MTPRRICVVTGTRAEYGLLRWLMRDISDDPDLALQVVATGSHLSPEFGLSYREIEADGFRIDEKVEMLLSADTTSAVAKAVGLAVIGFTDTFVRLAPDIVVVVGDRYEILAVAETTLLLGIPLAHIAGGDVTEGAFDDSIRHAVTKMAHLHLATNDDSARHLRQLGEEPWRIHVIGNPALDLLSREALPDRDALLDKIGFIPRHRNLLVTYHPETRGTHATTEDFAELLAALDTLGPGYGILFTRPNADPEGRALDQMIDDFLADHANAAAVTWLGSSFYFAAIEMADVVVGNSSSGLLEAPSLKTPTVNIGSRQKGRLRAQSVLDCPAERGAVLDAIKTALSMDCRRVENPYGDGHASQLIHRVLKEAPPQQVLLNKRFIEQ